jgi:FkbM family methyltransferase
MNTFLKTRVTKLRDELSDRFLEFKPYIGLIASKPEPLRFFYGTPQAVDWYDPLQRHTQVEFEWMADRVRGGSEKIIDAGAYHGLYTLILAQAAGPGGEVVAVDPVPSNMALIEVNLLINGLQQRARIEGCAVSREEGTILLSSGSCGHIVNQGGSERPARRLSTILPGATVAKVDIEGEEFGIFPQELDAMPEVHTWNVEIHPGKGRDSDGLLKTFASRGFELLWVNRDTCQVETYPQARPWTTRTSIIAVRS